VSFQRISVFISSDIEEFKITRKWLAQSIRETKTFEPILLEESGARAEEVANSSLRTAKDCEVYVGLFGRDYSSLTIREFREAREAHRPQLLYVRGTRSQRDPKLQSFIEQEIGQSLKYHEFQDDQELISQVPQDLQTLFLETARLGMGVRRTSERASENEHLRRRAIQVSPTSMRPGGIVTVSGTGFKNAENLELVFDGNAIISKIFCSQDGEFLTWWNIPEAPVGVHHLQVKGPGEKPVEAAITIIPYVAGMTVNAKSGDSRLIEGFGFSPSSLVVTSIDNITVATVITSALGSLKVQFVIPILSSGKHRLSLIDKVGVAVTMLFDT
jgi:hypothetical protein